MKGINQTLNPQGSFVFNTSGADFRFSNDDLNQKHVLHHPFYQEFNNALRSKLNLQKFKREYTFDSNEIERIMEENGFGIEKFETQEIEYSSENLLEICLIGGHMQTFQKQGIDLSMEEREKILKDSLDYALKKSSPNIAPVIETGAHYFVKHRVSLSF